ncbi:amino acid ABC transporter substrate-binding protein [Alphaproteobacteria bacterium]|nr:amino acid ABC transporter substrate-binding protein [Alphaproteobacteria bacterium]
MKKLVEIFAIAGLMSVAASVSSFAAQDTLRVVQDRGYVKCGVSQGLPGFSNPDDKGNWKGIDVDFCRAVAAAIFGTDEKVKFTPLSAKERFTALQSGEVDLLARNTTWSMHRDTALGVDFTGVNYYDGQGFMVRSELGIESTLELDGASLCTNLGTTTELNAADYFRTNDMEYEIVAFEKADEAVSAYNSGRCDAYTTDQSALYAQRLKLTNPGGHIVLPQIISKEPLGPVVRQGDNQWGDIVRWTHNAMLNGEELGVTSANVEQMKSSKNPSIRRLLGFDGSFGENMGINNDWAYHILRTVGNYAETFERNVGKDTPLGIARGVNALWKDGGLQYAPPIR